MIINGLECMQASVSVEPVTVNQESTLYLMILISETIPQNGKIEIQIPDYTSFLESNLACQINDPSDITITSCQVSTEDQSIAEIIVGNQLTASSGSQLSIFLQVQSFKNPPSTFQDQSFKIKTLTSNDELLQSIENGVFISTLQPDNFQVQQISPLSNVIGQQNTQLQLTLTTKNKVPQQGQIRIRTPYWNPQASSPIGYFNESQLSCQVQGLDFELQCTSVMNNEMQEVVIQTLNEQEIAASTSFIIIIQGFRNPITANIQSGFRITSYDQNIGRIDESNNLSVQVTQPNTLTNIQILIDEGSRVINELSSLRLNILPPFPLNQNCILSLQLPNDYSKLGQSLNFVYTFGMFGSFRTLSFTILTSNEIQINGACNIYRDNSIQGTLRFVQFFNPSSVRDTGTFIFRIKDQNGVLLAQSTVQNMFIPKEEFQPGTIRSISLSLNKNTVQEQSNLLIDGRPTNKLSQNGQLIIQIPNTFSLGSSCQMVPKSTIYLKSDASCVIEALNKIRISNLFYSFGYDPNIDGSLEFTIANALINPTSVPQNIGSFIFQSFDLRQSQQELKDEGIASNPFVIQPGNLENIYYTLTRQSYNTSLAELKIEFTILHVIPSHGSIKIYLPSDLKIYDTQYSETSCLQTYDNTVIEVFCEIIGQAITLQNDFDIDLEAGELVIFSIDNVTLPRYSGILSEVIHLHTQDQNGQTIDLSTKYPQIQDTLEMHSCQIYTMSQYNLDSTSLQITFSSSIELYQSDHLNLNLPQQLEVNSHQFSCLTNSASVICNFNGDNILISLPNNILWDNLTQIEFTGFINPSSTRPLTGFELQFVDSQLRKVNECKQQLQIQTSLPNQLLEVLLSQSNTEPEVDAIYTITIADLHNEDSYILLTFPECVDIPLDLQIKGFQGTPIIHSQIDITQIKFYSQGFNQFHFHNLTNPSEECMNSAQYKSFLLQIYEDQDLQYIMQQKLQGLEPSLSCVEPCQSCELTNKSYCFTCINNLFALDGECLQSCPNKYYESLQTCKQCDSNCKSCLSSTQCLECDSGFLLDHGQCVNQCGSGKVQIGLECQYCQHPCLQCDSQVDYCTTCKTGFYLQKDLGICHLECPQYYSVFNQYCEQNNQIKLQKSNLQTFQEYVSYFPLIVLQISFILISIGSYLFKKESFISSILLMLTQVNYLISTLMFSIISFFMIKQEREAYFLFAVCTVSLLICQCQNIVYVRLICKNLEKQDNQSDKARYDYYNWKQKHRKTRLLMYLMTSVVSFHSIKFFDSLAYGLKYLSMFMYRQSGNLKKVYTKLAIINLIVPKFVQIIINCLVVSKIENITYKCTLIENTIIVLLACIFTFSSSINDRKLSDMVIQKKKLSHQQDLRNTSYKSQDTFLPSKVEFFRRISIGEFNKKKKKKTVQFDDLNSILQSSRYQPKKFSSMDGNFISQKKYSACQKNETNEGVDFDEIASVLQNNKSVRTINKNAKTQQEAISEESDIEITFNSQDLGNEVKEEIYETQQADDQNISKVDDYSNIDAQNEQSVDDLKKLQQHQIKDSVSTTHKAYQIINRVFKPAQEKDDGKNGKISQVLSKLQSINNK